MTKAATLGWLEDLESWEKPRGKRKKTILYWKKLLREAGLDPTNIGALTRDRKGWKEVVMKRMRHLEKFERSRGHKWTGAAVVRNVIRREEEVFICDVCGKSCKSKGGLVNHRRRMHEASALKKTFKCSRCAQVFTRESDLKNHAKICGGAEASDAGRRKCVCGKEYSRGYFRKHSSRCAEWLAAQEVVAPTVAPVAAPARTGGARLEPCDDCGRVMRKDNIARHKGHHCTGQ